MLDSSKGMYFSLSSDDYGMHYFPVEPHSDLTQWLTWHVVESNK